MDRGRYRALLRRLFRSGVVTAGALFAAASLRAQGGSPVPSVAVPPPGPTTSATPDAATRKRAAERMTERRQREIAAGEEEFQRRLDQLPPEEREAFKRNLKVWRELTPAEREVVRKDESERMRAEVDKALQQTGLHLDKDQHEVFALRYRQERRRLERELQEKLEAERARRLPALIDGLKKEFADRAAAMPTPTPAGSATSTPMPTPKLSPSTSTPRPATPSVSVPGPPPTITHPGG